MERFYKAPTPTDLLFNNQIELLPSVNELFELELAYLEYTVLNENEYLDRTAYAKTYKGEKSLHFMQCSDVNDSLIKSRSALANAYFKNGQYSTGYATHSLFPYRGKFHPQLIKGIMNILGIKKNDTILDPMAGSGTTNIEAALMGINSFAIDISPFCQLMIKVKYDAIRLDLKLLEKLQLNSSKLFTFFQKGDALDIISDLEKPKKEIYYLALLAYLDALGYSKRVKRSTHQQLFPKVLVRYIETVKDLMNNPYFNKREIGDLQILGSSDALQIDLPDESIDGIITSPPYSFAIDYVSNDKDQLEYLGYDTEQLRKKLIGLKGKTKKEKLENYFQDMDLFCKESARVLKKQKYLVIIIGSNTNQTGGIRLEQKVIDSALRSGMNLVKSILKPIKGMRNTMKEEYILIFEKG